MGTVTIVVPAFNVERYLGSCLDSLQAQSAWPDCRVIVVDDGSTDQTGQIAADAAARSEQIRTISQPNAGPGPGAARNVGLDLVDSAFVMFCDGDDELTPRAVELLREGLERFDVDLAVGASEQFPEPRTWLWSGYFQAGELTRADIEDIPLLAHNAATGNKMFRTAALRKRGWRFAERIHHQDTVVTVPALATSDGLALIGDVVHRYRKRAEGDSIMDSHYTRLDNYWDHLLVIETLSRQLGEYPPGRRELVEAFIARSFQGFASRAPGLIGDDQLEEFFRRTRDVISTLSVESIEKGTRHAGERAAYVTMLEDDFAAFQRLPWHLDHLDARGGDLFLSVPTRTPEHRTMVKAGGTRALAFGLTIDERTVRFRLRLRVHGARDLATGVNSITLRLVPLDGGQPRVRELVPLAPADQDWGADESLAEVALSRDWLVSGRYALRLVFRTPTGKAERWARRPVGESAGSLLEQAQPPEHWYDPSTGAEALLQEDEDRALLVLSGLS